MTTTTSSEASKSASTTIIVWAVGIEPDFQWKIRGEGFEVGWEVTDLYLGIV